MLALSTLTAGGRRLTGGLAVLGGPARRGFGLITRYLLPAAVAMLTIASVDEARPGPPAELIATLAAAGAGLALYWRHAYPRTVAVVAVAGSLVVLLLVPDVLFPYPALVALWALTVARSLRASLPALAAVLAVTAVSWPGLAPGDTGFAMALVVVVWAMAEATRSRRAAIEQAARQATEREQNRLTRELHDLIAHSVSVMVVQAAAGDDIFDHDPAAARRALRSIESSGREALAELRRLLAAIGPAETGESRRPQPDLDRIPELIEPLRAIGLAVDLHRPGDPTGLPAGVQLSAYRIVREALTNVVRHAHATRVEVAIVTSGGGLEVTVTDDGTGHPGEPGRSGRSGRSGRGLAGMRERTALLGGTLEAGPRSGGGFQVRARLPLQPPR